MHYHEFEKLTLKKLAFRALGKADLDVTFKETVVSKYLNFYTAKILRFIVKQKLNHATDRLTQTIKDYNDYGRPSARLIAKMAKQRALSFDELVPFHLWPLFFAGFGPAEDKVLLSKSDRVEFRKEEKERKDGQNLALEILKVGAKREKSARLRPAEYISTYVDLKAKRKQHHEEIIRKNNRENRRSYRDYKLDNESWVGLMESNLSEYDLAFFGV